MNQADLVKLHKLEETLRIPQNSDLNEPLDHGAYERIIYGIENKEFFLSSNSWIGGLIALILGSSSLHLTFGIRI